MSANIRNWPGPCHGPDHVDPELGVVQRATSKEIKNAIRAGTGLARKLVRPIPTEWLVRLICGQTFDPNPLDGESLHRSHDMPR